MWTKRIIWITLTLAFFAIVWYVQGQNIRGISILENANFSTFDEILLLNNSAFGYSSIQAYTLYYSLPFILFLTNLFLQDELPNIVRSKNRDYLYFKKISRLIIAALLFSSFHTLVNLILTSTVFEYAFLKEIHFPLISLYNFFGIFLFYCAVGILYELVKDLLNSINLSFFLVLLLISSLFFIEKLYLNQTWGPLKDLVVYTMILEGKWDITDLLITYLRQIFIVTVICIIGSVVHKRKDIIL